MEVSSYCEVHKREKNKHPKPFEDGEFFYSCPECFSELEEQERLEEEKRLAREKQENINNRLNNAMLAPRFKEKTFENYIVENKGQEKVVRVARWFLDNMNTSTGLILIGQPGTGKNHIVSAIITEAIEKHNKTALFTETLKIVRAIKESWRKNDEAESQVIKSFIEPDILAIDEIGVQFGSDTERMYLTEIINDRYNHQKPTILMGNVLVSDLGDIVGERAVDRFRENGKLVVLDWDSYRIKP